MNLSEEAKNVIKTGSIKVRVIRSGMYQQLTFSVKQVKLGNITYTELYTERMVDLSELSRVANQLGLPVEAHNGKAFPKGTSATDFQNLSA